MDVKSMARIKYSYNIEGVNLSGLSQSNIVTTEIRKKGLNVKKLTNSNYFKINDIITYNIILSNTGNVPITNIIINDDILNQNLIVDSLYAFTLDNNEKSLYYEIIDNKLNIQIEKINPNETMVITYKVIILNSINKIKSELSIVCDEIKEIKKEIIELNQGYAEIECIKKVSNDYAFLNTDLSYELTLKNKGNVDAYNVEVYDELPLTYELNKDNAVTINDKNIDYIYQDHILSLTIPKVNASDEISIQINGRIIK